MPTSGGTAMTKTRDNALFVLLAYGFFWALLIATLAVFGGDETLFGAVVPYVQVLGTWAPTIALLVLFRKLYPGWTIRGFYRDAFKGRLKPGVLSVATLAYIAIFTLVVSVDAINTGVAISSLLSFSVGGLLVTLFSGAMGEESGWRGHLQRQVEKRHSVIVASLIVGVIWAFWHAITWIPLIQAGLPHYVPVDIVSKMSSAMIIGICFSRCRNLFVPMWIHFVSNILANGTQESLIDQMPLYVGVEALVAVCYMIWFTTVSKKEAAAAPETEGLPSPPANRR